MPRLLLLLLSLAAPIAASADHHENDAGDDGFVALFDGESLTGWSASLDEHAGLWRVENGAIVGQTTDDDPIAQNTFLVWDGSLDDFDLRLQIKIHGHNSGVQYRSQPSAKTPGRLEGYQADFDYDGQYAGMLYDEMGRGIVCKPGERVTLVQGAKPQVKATDDVSAAYRQGEWNELRIVAQGNRLRHYLNGTLTADVTDNDTAAREMKGKLGLQLHRGPAMTIEMKNVRLKRLPTQEANAGHKKVVFIGGTPSHAVGAHEFNAGSLLLAEMLETGAEGIVAQVYTNGWPTDPTALDNADAIVCGFNGGTRSPLVEHAEQVQRAVDRGAGLVCWHYAVEVPEAAGPQMLDWLGGYFEPWYSVNPWWTPEGATLADHPIASGVEPFAVNDEWYYHMRFADDRAGITPILSALPPRDTLSRKDGPHSNNPHVRQSVLQRAEPQVLAWAFDREAAGGKGRAFGFTGGHVHANWADDDFRRLMLNAIVWTAGGDVPSLGIPSATPDADELAANMDPKKSGKTKSGQKQTSREAGEPAFVSPRVDESTPGHAVEIAADIEGATDLYLVVTAAGESSFDWADWVRPAIETGNGVTSLHRAEWAAATSGWGRTHQTANAAGQPARVDGAELLDVVGTHAPSVIHYDLAALGIEGAKRFTAQGAIDDGGAAQDGQSAMRFAVFTEQPTEEQLAKLDEQADEVEDIRAPESAVSSLDVAEGLAIELIASEPMLYSPSNIDVDHLGRIWVAEIVNYRHFRNTDNPPRPEGDRILVLQDTDGDGVCDAKTTFYQSPDIDSPHGVLVLPNPDGSTRVIVSAGEHVFNLYDDDGDLKADRREVMFSGIDGVQHDHGIHAFVFGPDGKLYFNFGNEGKQLKDADGNVVVDLRGEEIVEDMRPYQMGMVFRCDLDGSHVETLGWNFRNNWELAVDSLGTIWQSDNDDDGNMGTRLNFVMEYGNYGYRDELTGAGWREFRTGWEDTVPERHWHLNDPGVVPNLIQTGAGSPTGIMVYEGDLLADYRGQVIHCDAGPNMVRAFPVERDGAGYSAELRPMVTGVRDQWFRPSDVCAAPDGSLIIADWYDPGVGGHRQQDVFRGRLFRLAPPESEWSVPKVDVSTPLGAIAALMSPNMATRYLGWRAIGSQIDAGGEARRQMTFALGETVRNRQTLAQARAAWAIHKLRPGLSSANLEARLASSDPDIRILAIRMARQEGEWPATKAIVETVDDASAAVRRETCIALAEQSDETAIEFWPTLAMQYDGQDRWYLEALGIAARGRWDKCLDALIEQTASPVLFEEGTSSEKPPSGKQAIEAKALRDIIWRSRAAKTPALLARLIRSDDTPTEELPRLLRSFDFQSESAAKNEALADLAFGPPLGRDEATDRMVRTEALDRVGSVDFEEHPEYRSQLDEVLAASRGTDGYLRLVRKFGLADRAEQMLADALSQPATAFAGDAIKDLAAMKKWPVMRAAARDDQRVMPLLQAMRRSAASSVVGLLTEVADDQSRPVEVRRAAVDAMARSTRGATLLLDRAEDGSLDASLRGAAEASVVTANHWPLRDRTAQVFPPKAGKDGEATPPISELLGWTGDVRRGRLVFNSVGTCSKCHVVDGIGKEVGPNLTEIGSKLSHEAMFTAILHPSAGISHNYETYLVLTDEGDIVTGLLVSETDDAVTLRTVNAENVTVERNAIEAMKRQEQSLMPADLQKVMSTQELVDVVQYMRSLKKKM